ncbi:hypothetical protein [Nonomuraea wenchangensis]|uniref:Uncharacterized protein n=1 Tax=Nonomuraea wenchangensis TaxID=568860 RepID=A0A1I0LL40_9ACTN|nr:hypothetical protein [Nonomuraea wenchangensis]SEU41325.1 hypothetical protein SAMN05421811_11927 [Nonomuraea wenchangensis]
MRRISWLTLLPAFILAIAACQPRVSRWVDVENRTGETVTVKWLGDTSYDRQLSAGEAVRIPVVSGGCLRDGAEDVIVAETTSGRRFTFGPPACEGGKWTLPAR